MKSMRFVQRNALRQFLDARPALRQAFTNLERQSISQSPFRTRPLRLQNTVTRGLHIQRFSNSTRSSPFAPRPRTQARRIPHAKEGRRCNSSSTTPASEGEKLSISQRMKKLSREYGWSALGVYLLLTALDFPFCFLAVRMLGTDRIGHWEHVALTWIKGLVSWPFPEREREVIEGAGDLVEAQVLGDGAKKRILEEESRAEYKSQEAKVEVEDHGYREAEQANAGSNASLWTQLALAYAIHKSFIFIRVPLTAAITPKVVKTLRGWGWNIGKMPKKSVTSGSGSGSGSSSASGVNTKGSKVKPDD